MIWMTYFPQLFKIEWEEKNFSLIVLLIFFCVYFIVSEMPFKCYIKFTDNGRDFIKCYEQNIVLFFIFFQRKRSGN